MIEIERVCANCKYWKSAGKFYGVARCAINAVSPDVGQNVEAVVILPGNATCLAYDDAFEPSDEYLDYLHEVEAQNDC